jgi:hypothetical protein
MAERIGGFQGWGFVAPGCRRRKAKAPYRGHNALNARASSTAEHHLVHDPSARQREQAADDKGESENPDHR